MSTVLASVLPTLSMVILYFVRSLIGRLGALVGVSTLFAISVAVFTNARRVDVFLATAAYVQRSLLSRPLLTVVSFVAVQAVFVGNTTLTGNQRGPSTTR